jgi:hypothetical protein
MAELPRTAIRHNTKNKPNNGTYMDALRLRRFNAARRSAAEFVFGVGLASL